MKLLPLTLSLFAALSISLADTPASQPEGELLYNGIRLPREWPPLNEIKAASREPMPVPYLAAPPSVICIDVGRQLFVDDFLIATNTLRRTFHHAQKYEGNPLLKPETALEKTGGLPEWRLASTACPFDDGVYYDPKDHLFKLWYMGGLGHSTLLATSKDGLHWTRPQLDVIPGTNCVIPYRPDFARDAFSPWLDCNTNNPAERWKAFLFARILEPPDTKRHDASWLYTSPDGVHWQQGPRVQASVGDNTTIFYNPFRKKWVMSVRQGMRERGRARMYYEVDEFSKLAAMKTADPVFWCGTDLHDLPEQKIQRRPQLYCLSPIAYESIMLASFSMHYGPENNVCEKGQFPKLTEIQLGYSRDGFHFSRPDRTSFIAATRRDGDWDRGYLRSAGSVCTIVGDRLYFYYCGFSGVAPDGTRHYYAGGSTHVAFLRRDGFASMDAGAEGGTLTTRCVKFSGKHLFVNAATTQGELRAEVLDEQGNIIAPFTKENCQPMKVDKTLQRLSWKGANDLAQLAGKPVKFRFHLTNGQLYSFWVSSDRNGASHGYVAAGGPGFTGPTDTVGDSSAR